MASIRRTLSLVPRAGTLLGEPCSVGSPLSKSSSCTTQNHSSPLGGLFSLLGSLDFHSTLFPGIFSKRPSRSQDRSKLKGQILRRSLCHFLACFLVGFFIGLAPYVTKLQVFSSVSVTSEKSSKDVTSVLEIPSVKRNTTIIGSHAKNSKLTNGDFFNEDMSNQKLLIIVTPTYARPFQAYYLNHLAHTLKLVRSPLLWIVVEMSSQSEETAGVLMRTGVMYRHLVCNKNSTEMRDMIVHQRNVALSHIEMHRLDGIVYFADEDNEYSVNIFEQMRQISRVGTWIVTKLTESKKNHVILQGPVCNGTQVIGWHTNELIRKFRRFHVELSGFAFNSTLLWDTEKWHRPTLDPIRQLDTVKDELQVSTFIEQFVEDESQMECIMQNSSRIMVWNLRLQSPYSLYPRDWFVKNNINVIDVSI